VREVGFDGDDGICWVWVGEGGRSSLAGVRFGSGS
jgi:hypothetical protein